MNDKQAFERQPPAEELDGPLGALGDAGRSHECRREDDDRARTTVRSPK